MAATTGRLARVAAAALAVAALAGCGAAGDGRGADQGRPGPVPPAPPARPLPATFALARFLPDEAAYRAEEGRIQQALARCLAEASFAHRPHVPRPVRPLVFLHGVFVAEPVATGSGFGIADEVAAARDAMLADPNRAMLARLPPTRRVAYLEARYGREPGGLGGCEARARKPAAAPAQPVDVDALFDGIVADQRLTALRPVWSACMRAAGFEVADWTGARQLAQRRVSAVVQRADGGGEPAPTARLAGFADARGFEVAVAVADARCRAGDQPTYRRVQDEHARRFIREHGAQLEGFRRSRPTDAGSP